MSKNTLPSLGYALSRIARTWNRRFMDILRSQGYYNLKPSFCAVFTPLFENDGQSAAHLARVTGMTRQTMSIYVAELHRRGYIKLVRDDEDRRVRRIFLTAKGSMLKKVFESANLSITKEICGRLRTAESEQMLLLLGKCHTDNA